jgi:hypothetical protein
MTTANDVERCPKCHGVIAIIGRVHNCVPREPIEVVIPHIAEASRPGGGGGSGREAPARS